jgi:hypothetical protein
MNEQVFEQLNADVLSSAAVTHCHALVINPFEWTEEDQEQQTDESKEESK